MLAIKERYRTCFYEDNDFYIIDNCDSCYWDMCMTTLKKVMRIKGLYASKPTCLIVKFSGSALFSHHGAMYFNTHLSNKKDFHIELLDFTAAENSYDSELLPKTLNSFDLRPSCQKIVVLDLGGFTYKYHFIYNDGNDPQVLLFDDDTQTTLYP